MSVIQTASELVKESIQQVIDIDIKEREEFYKKKQEIIPLFVKLRKDDLENAIYANITDRNKWYIEIILDKDVLKEEIMRIKKELWYSTDSGKRNELLEIYTNRLKYINIEDVEPIFNKEGYHLEKVETITQSYFGFYTKKKILHRLSIVDETLAAPMIEKYITVCAEDVDRILTFIMNELAIHIKNNPTEASQWQYEIALDAQAAIKENTKRIEHMCNTSMRRYEDAKQLKLITKTIQTRPIDKEIVFKKLDTLGYAITPRHIYQTWFCKSYYSHTLYCISIK